MSVLLNTGNGTFAPKVDYHVSVSTTGAASVVALDLNGDGLLDLAVACSSPFGDRVSVLLNTGNGTFAPHVDYLTGMDPV